MRTCSICRSSVLGLALAGSVAFVGSLGGAESPPRATLRVLIAQRSAHRIPRNLTGKFAEHLGNNIYNGMSAQILKNPTFADFPFWTGQTTPDGVTTFQFERDKVDQEIRRGARRQGWPEPDLDRLVEDYHDGLACWWTRVGGKDAVAVSPDTGPHGGRAQRIDVRHAGPGIAQWTYLPLHRVKRFEFELLVRSPDLRELLVCLVPNRTNAPVAPDRVPWSAMAAVSVSNDWQVVRGTLDVRGADATGIPPAADEPIRFEITAQNPGQFVIGRALLRPADHVQGADPDVVRLLKESHLPLLRWPGGNFVSGYHWEDGVGPLERRPTRPNFAWGGVEPNLFGTEEFVAFCRDVGCEPMICVNAGNGSPEEAARWVEYCNGSVQTPLGRRRAANGHPEPYRIRFWEVGNELWGKWQVHWTTAKGYVDRYESFAKAMLAADPAIALCACGAPVFWGEDWNDTLIEGAGARLRAITDHPLIGGDVPPSTNPLDVFRDFMAVPQVLEQKWTDLRNDLGRAGVKEPRLAVTELQLFAHLKGSTDASAPVRLTHENLVNPGTQAEALYDVLIYHAAVRLAPFVEMVTHSATVNHGGGLRKERERVYANPCYYAQAAFADFADATPLAVELTAPVERAPLVLPDLKRVTEECAFRAVDTLAAVAKDGALLLSIVHRGEDATIPLTVELQDFRAGSVAEVRTLAADVPWAVNTLEQPEAVKPVDSRLPLAGSRFTLNLKPYSVVRVRIPTR